MLSFLPFPRSFSFLTCPSRHLFSPVNHSSCHSFLFPRPSILSSFRGWPVKPAILPSLFIFSPLPRESFLSSCFDCVPSILSAFSLVTYPAYYLVISFLPFPHFFCFSLVHPVISFRRWTIHPFIPFCSLIPPSCHPFLLPLQASPSCQTV